MGTDHSVAAGGGPDGAVSLIRQGFELFPPTIHPKNAAPVTGSDHSNNHKWLLLYPAKYNQTQNHAVPKFNYASTRITLLAF